MNKRANEPVLTSGLLAILNHSAQVHQTRLLRRLSFHHCLMFIMSHQDLIVKTWDGQTDPQMNKITVMVMRIRIRKRHWIERRATGQKDGQTEKIKIWSGIIPPSAVQLLFAFTNVLQFQMRFRISIDYKRVCLSVGPPVTHVLDF